MIGSSSRLCLAGIIFSYIQYNSEQNEKSIIYHSRVVADQLDPGILCMECGNHDPYLFYNFGNILHAGDHYDAENDTRKNKTSMIVLFVTNAGTGLL